jgi:hypothetical protein
MSTQGDETNDALQRSLDVHAALIAILFRLLLLRGGVTREDIAEEVERATNASTPEVAAMLALFHSKFVTSN